VQGQILLDYAVVCDPAELNAIQLRVIDPLTGAIVRTYADDTLSSVDLSALGVGDFAYGGAGAFEVADATSGKYLATREFGFNGTTWQQGIAWRSGEVWIGEVDITVPENARTLTHITVRDEGGYMIGPAAFDPIPFVPGDYAQLAFDRDQLVIGLGRQLIWMNIGH
jgi:hypothetical protein